MQPQLVHNNSKLKQRRQDLRNGAPKAERILWNVLKGKNLNGLKFRRQHSVGPFILDFYCPAMRLAIEIDGPSHFEEGADIYDKQRQEYIEQFNIHFLRFTNRDVYENLDGVVMLILQWLVEQQQNPDYLRFSGT